jgi:hypothetical protein
MPAIITDSTPTAEYTIAGKQYNIPRPYVAGHVLTAGEASSMNQTLAENVRNNMAKKLEGAFEGKPATETEAAVEPISAEEAQAQVTAYAKEYEFGERGPSSPRMDPEEKEARSMAATYVAAWVKSQGKTAKDYETEELDALREQFYTTNKVKLHEKAKAVVDARKSITEGLLAPQPAAPEGGATA